MARRLLLALLLVATAGALVATPAAAHRGEQSYLYLDVSATDLDGRVEMPYTDLRELFGLRLEQPPESIMAELEANRDRILAYAEAHTSIGAGGVAWELTFDEIELLGDGTEGDEPGYAIFPFQISLPTSDVPRRLEVTFDPFLAELDGRDSIVLVANDWQRGVFDEEANELLVLTPGSPSGVVDLGDPSQWLNFTGSIRLGVDHIRTGPDHIFFVLVLLLPSVLVFASTWRPAPTFGAALWRVLKIVSMFTVAHSITFTLAGLELIPLPPSRLVETVIALSIAAAAAHNLRPVLVNREWLMAFMFGLFHGLGFASLVQSLDTGRGTQLISLLGRNVGIEVGQIVVILLSFPALFLLRRTRYYRPLFVAGSVVLTAVSTLWAVERIFDIDLGFNRFIELSLKWPRSGILMVLGTVAAVAIHQVEQRAGRLLPVGSAQDGAGGAGADVDESVSVPSVM